MGQRRAVLVLLTVLSPLSACSGKGGGGGPTLAPSPDAVPGAVGASAAEVPVATAPPRVDPACLDGAYREALPDPSVPLDDLVFSKGDPMAYALAVLGRRYPFGRTLVERGGEDCASFLRGPKDAAGVLGRLGTLVHECGHVHDHRLSTFDEEAFVIRPDLTLRAALGDTTDRHGLTFARSLIRQDGRHTRRPPCPPGVHSGCDDYADTYLDGDPTDKAFQGGDQGFGSLLEEVVQYVNTLAVAVAVPEAVPAGVQSSKRDGLLTMLWYLTRYLRLARLEHPSVYAHLAEGDGGRWRRLVLTVWGRAWLYLDASEGLPGLGIEDEELLRLVMEPELVGEIERLRGIEGCR
jgi:hypothetical protein